MRLDKLDGLIQSYTSSYDSQHNPDADLGAPSQGCYAAGLQVLTACSTDPTMAGDGSQWPALNNRSLRLAP